MVTLNKWKMKVRAFWMAVLSTFKLKRTARVTKTIFLKTPMYVVNVIACIVLYCIVLYYNLMTYKCHSYVWPQKLYIYKIHTTAPPYKRGVFRGTTV